MLTPDEARAERRELRRRRRTALLLVAPLLAFVLFAFFAPIANMLYRSVYNPTLAELIPQTLAHLKQWDEAPLPSAETFASMAIELKKLSAERKAGVLAAAVNQAYPGASSLINSTARRMRGLDDGIAPAEAAQALRDADNRWSEPDLWHAVKRSGQVHTITHYLTALDLERNQQGEIVQRESARIYVQLYSRTLGMALAITLMCIALGYPLAYYLCRAPKRLAGVLMIFVLLPFWTSLLARTTAWIALLQPHGIINSVLLSLGVIRQPLELLYTGLATVIVMTHILLPFMILPLYSVMRGIDPGYVRAAQSLGSTPWSAFWRVFLPLSMPGLSAGALLVFIISIGYYIIPALVGGTDGQMISNIIAFHMQRSNNWGLAAALGTLLLAVIVILYWVYDRLVGARNLRLA
ncbi:ABC transporter permease [Pusillimonas noertemannii]|uniref:Putative spermidine/putrescine transport system permease protein n=1 Tax=Pusillimonas noertemannii TaxID=305977 RepID=A0A2U1CHK6_9BURK|nr:ABC transporter permease [Pusillimonas noertemannii]NYT70268.1 ABC transporter permease [Pusillimonas noertemannii]PVY60411.1 putative spermidine/putrescine transport system permease protein [Pusillimonas noertemannii]TFL08091.1 ABC transporter permease [Pusillimonas noertemannii]